MGMALGRGGMRHFVSGSSDFSSRLAALRRNGAGNTPVVSVLVLFVLSCSVPLMMHDGRGGAKRIALVAGGVTLVAAIVAAVLPSWSPRKSPAAQPRFPREDRSEASAMVDGCSRPAPCHKICAGHFFRERLALIPGAMPPNSSARR